MDGGKVLINKLKRYIYIYICLMIRDPYKRASFIKKTHHLGKQGDDCAFFIFKSNFWIFSPFHEKQCQSGF